MVVTESDAQLIESSLANPEEFAHLFDRHELAVYRYLARRVGESDAADLLAETFRVAFESRARYDCHVEDALPWLYGIARKLILERRRRSLRQAKAYERFANQATDNVGDFGESNVVNAAATAEKLNIVIDCLSRAPRKYAEPLLLFAWEELSYEDVARTMNLPVGTVRSRISRMRARLRHQLERTAPNSRGRSTTLGIGEIVP